MSDNIRKFPNKVPKGENILELFDNIQKLLDDPKILKRFVDQQIEDTIIKLSEGKSPEYEKLLRQFQWGIQKNLRKYKNQKVKALKANEMMQKHAEMLSRLSVDEMREKCGRLKMSKSPKLLLKIGNAVTVVRDGVYEYDVECLPCTSEDDALPPEFICDDEDYDDFVDFISRDFFEFWNFMHNDYSFDNNRRKLVNNTNWDAFYCAVLSKNDAKYFRGIFEHYRNEIDNLPSGEGIIIHPTLRVKYNSLKLLLWFSVWSERVTNLCLRPAVVSCLFSEDTVDVFPDEGD